MSRRRVGFTLFEVLVAAVIVAATAVVVMQFLAVTARQARSLRDRQYALEEASDMMERLVALSWEELSQQGVAQMGRSEWAYKALPDAMMKIDVLPSDAGLEGKQITVEISRRDRSGGTIPLARLVAWRYRAADRYKLGR